jgi:protein-S-isoprenylcysteine O-methyltransferase Ste14
VHSRLHPLLIYVHLTCVVLLFLLQILMWKKNSIVRAIGFLFSCTAWWLLYIPPFALSLWGVDWCAYDNLVYQLHPIL